jgi:hypothetical protein
MRPTADAWSVSYPAPSALPTATVIHASAPPPVEKIVVEMTLEQARALRHVCAWASSVSRTVAKCRDGVDIDKTLLTARLNELYPAFADALRGL